MKIYGDSISGNCPKVNWTSDFLGLAYEWIESSALSGVTRTAAFLAPLVLLDDGLRLAQGSA